MSNLLKRGTTINKDERVIDYNDIIRQKLQAVMNSKQGTMDADGFINGLHADVVEELISDDAADALTNESSDMSASQDAAATLEQINEQVQQIINDANEQAERIISDAHNDADRISEEARQNGYYEGCSKAEEEVNNRINELEQEYEAKKQQLEQEYSQMKEAVEPELVNAIVEVFRKVTHVVSEDNHDIILHLINDVMHNAEGCKDFTIKVSPDDYRFLVNNQGKIYCAMSKEVNIDIVEDMGMERNQCMIETNTGIFNCGLDVELDNLIKNIKLLSCVQ